MSQITPGMIECWRINFGLDKRSPKDAMRWWNDTMRGLAPAGAVAALGMLLQERETMLRALQASGPSIDGWAPRMVLYDTDGHPLATRAIEMGDLVPGADQG
jgi:hypothetical protein